MMICIDDDATDTRVATVQQIQTQLKRQRNETTHEPAEQAVQGQKEEHPLQANAAARKGECPALGQRVRHRFASHADDDEFRVL